MPKKTLIIILLASIIALGGFLRIYKLNSVPPGLYPDEAINGNNAYEALKNNDFKVFYPENNGREGLFINLVAYSIKYLGLKPISIRLVSVIIGILTILTTYFLAKELFLSQSMAVLSSFFLAISFWHLNFSRIGFRAILVPLILTLGFYFLFKYLRKREISSLLYSTFFFGLGFYTYIAYRVVFLLILIPVFFDFLNSKKRLKDFFTRWLIFFLLVFILSLPLLLYFYHHPTDFISRANGVSIFSTSNPIKSLSKSTLKTLLMFNVSGDCNWRHNLACQPQLFYFQGLLFIIGIFLLLKKTKAKRKKEKERAIFLLGWLVIFLLPEVLTAEGLPHALRAIGVIPAVYIIIAFALDKILRRIRGETSKTGFLIIVLFLSFFLSLITFHRYFFEWAKNENTAGAFTENYLETANYINSLPRNQKKYIICEANGTPVRERGSSQYLPMPCQTVMFLTGSFLPEGRKLNNIYYFSKQESKSIPNKKGLLEIRIK